MKFFIMRVAETLEQIVQRDGKCPFPGNILSQVGWGSEQTYLFEDVPVNFRWGWMQ